MHLSHDDDYNLPISKFEKMLKTNNVFFFDSMEFESIIQHYLDMGKIALARKAIKLGLEQHPSSSTLKLLQVELYIFENKLAVADKMLNELYELEPNNDEIYIHKATIFSKKDQHEKAIDVLKLALTISEEKADIYSMLGMSTYTLRILKSQRVLPKMSRRRHARLLGIIQYHLLL